MGQPPILTRHDELPTAVDPSILPVDKPQGITSFGVVRQVRRLLGVKKVGHAGTLDPMATGLLILLVGREATRLQDRFMGLPKVYSGTLRLGETTPSFDADTEVARKVDASHISDQDLDRVRQTFEGEVEQLPPMYSAVKVGGERLYKKARRGEEIERKARRVRISRIAFTGRRGDDVDFEVDCSRGTYIRSLAHDIGEALGVGAHLIALRREAIGEHRVDDAWSLEELQDSLAPTEGESRT